MVEGHTHTVPHGASWSLVTPAGNPSCGTPAHTACCLLLPVSLGVTMLTADWLLWLHSLWDRCTERVPLTQGPLTFLLHRQLLLGQPQLCVQVYILPVFDIHCFQTHLYFPSSKILLWPSFLPQRPIIHLVNHHTPLIYMVPCLRFPGSPQQTGQKWSPSWYLGWVGMMQRTGTIWGKSLYEITCTLEM